MRNLSRKPTQKYQIDLPFRVFSDIIDFMLTKRVKSKIIGEHQRHDKDTGSAEVQIGVLSRRIDELAAHLKKNSKDNHSRRGLLKLVSQRRKLLSYLRKKEPKTYEKLIKKLDLKK
jgi:small subunit ribosomal protein S15